MATPTRTRITATELARNLSDILNRIRYQGETFVVERNGVDVAVLEPPMMDRLPILAEVGERLKGLEWPDDGFADDLEWVKKNQPPLPQVS